MEKWFQDKNFPTEKREQGIKARKGHRDTNTRKMHRAFGILLAAALIFQTVPFDGIAVSASESSGGGLCGHHTEHTPDCGYKEAEPGHGCTHEHTEDCYRTVEGEDGSTTKELDCHHEHDESCGCREAAEGSPCTFMCEICKGGTDEIPEGKTDDNDEINDGDSENPGTENGNETEEPGDGQEECICEELCAEDSINRDCPVCGAEDASLSDCKGKDVEDSTEDAEENTDQPEDTSLCKHHPEHDDTCGYQPASENGEGSPCTYECRICPIEKLIAALPDAADIRSDNADKVRAQLEEILALYRELTEDEQEQIDMIRCCELQGTLDEANVSMLAESHTDRQEGDVVSVTVDSTTTYYADISEAWTAATAADSPVTVTLLGDVISSKRLDVGDGCDITITSIRPGSKLLCTDIWEAFQVKEGGRLVIEDGTFEATSKNGVGCACVAVRGGEAVIKGGTYLATTTASGALYIGGGKLEISGGLFESFNAASGKSVTALNHVSGEVNISGGIFRAKGTDGGGIYIWKEDAIANISGGIFEGGRYGMAVEKGTVSISGGTFVGGEDIALGNLFNSSRYTLSGFLKNYGDNSASEHYAYFDQNDNPITKGLDKGSRIMETVTVKVCEHKGENVCEYMHTEGTLTHQKACLACGMVENSEKCRFDENGKCPCGAVLAVTLPDNLALTYTGKEQEPAVTVTVDGRTLAAENNYEVNYSDNINAGTDTAKITVTGTAFTGTVTKTFFIGKATPKIEWNPDNRELTYTGQPADIKPVITLVNGEKYTGEIHYSWYGVADSLILPTDARTYDNVIASIPEQDNYNAAITKIGLNLHIVPAGQTAPAAPTAEDANIKDTSITLTVIENAEYKRGDGEWQESPTFTELEPNQAYTFYARLKEDINHNASPSSAGTSITTRKAMLENASVTVSGTYTYTGAAIVPPVRDVVVMVNGKTVDSSQYTISASNNINAGKATLTVTATETGNYSGSVSSTFTIGKATLTITANDQTITYGGSIATGKDQVTATGLVGGDTLESVTLEASTSNVPGGNITPSSAVIKRGGEDVTANYNITYQPGTLAISYMDAPGLQYNDSNKKDYYNRDVAVTAVSEGGHTYTVSDTLGGDYKDSYTISAQEGTVTKTLYFKDGAGHMSDGVEVTVKFDLTPPTGEIAVGAKWWQNVLHFISFGNYAAKEYTVTIKAEDKNGSGIGKIEYAIVAGTDQYTDAGALEAAGLSWTEYDSSSRPTVDAGTSQYVVYARLTDNVGNVTYISTDGILLDRTAPTVDGLAVPEKTKKDVTAGFTFTVNEAADYYYVVLPKDSNAPSSEDIIVTCGGTLPEGKTGNAIAGVVDSGKGAVSADTPGVSVEAENLSPNTAYMVYVTAIDRAVDITDSEEGTPAGNIADVVNTGFTTKKTLPVITKAPAVAGTYGQSVGEMTITVGTAQAGSTVLAGTWTVSDADKNEKPSAGTSEVTVIFKPDNADYDSVPVQASLTVSQRNLNAEGVTVSEVAGNYTYTGSEIKPPVAAGTGTPTSGISISDSGAVLTANDFTVSYSNNKDAGTASVTITGKGNYTGSVTRTFTIGKAPGREVPDVSGSHTDNGQTYTYTVTPTEGAVYRMDNGAWQAENIFKDIKPGTSVTFYAMMPEDKNYEEGTPKYITVDFPKLTPAAPALTYKADRTNPADVKVAITPVSGAEYSFDGGKTWTESNEQGGFTTSDTVTLAIRLKGTDTHNQSPARTMTVNLAKEDREAPPAFSLKVEANGETDYTVTIPATEGCEYSFDGEHWSDVNVKTGVSVGETVTGYKRYKETNDYNASSAVSAKETMPKFTVKTPVISPAGGSYSGSVSVTITCGSTDAEIYYTTDGSTPGRSSTRYTGAFTVSAPATVKAVAIKDGLNDSAVATVSYTKKDGGGSGGGNSGGSSGGSENNGGSGGNDEGQGSGGGGSTNPGNGNATPQPSVTQPTDTNTSPGNETAPGTGTTPVNPGNGNTVRPGTAPGSGIGTPAQGTKQPFIKDEDGKTGWDVIRAEEEQAQEGSIINVDMNGSVVVPGDIFDSIKGKDITVTFDMGNGIIWSVDGKSITTDKAGDIDFSVKTETNTIPVDIVNNVTGERYSIQISLAYEGEFGFTAVLSIGLGRENAGYTASLYYYNESTGELEFICSDEVAEDGTVSLAFTHASDYVIAIDGEEESDSATEPAQPEDQDGDSTGQAEESPQAGQAWRPWWLIVVGALVVIMGIGVFFVVKKGKDGDSGQ
ncbi:hypothetical protein D3Z45_19220 [Lachnospiraceae bacterium]|nr:hypothetical protein [Lachnospiraceae bacterium]